MLVSKYKDRKKVTTIETLSTEQGLKVGRSVTEDGNTTPHLEGAKREPVRSR